MNPPTPEQVLKAREKAGLTQAQAADLVHASTTQRWTEWESGKHRMSVAMWELFLLKTGQRVP